MDESVVVGLLHRADWTRLGLAGVTGGGSTVLLAPGRRYRYESDGHVSGCDGTRPWEMPADDHDDVDVREHWVSGPEPPLPELLCPAWLLVGSRLEVRGRVRACGRDAWEVAVTRRPGSRQATRELSDRAEAVVDAELGVVLRLVRFAETPEPKVSEFVRLDLDAVIDPDRFAPPPGSTLGESWGEALNSGGPAWRAAKTVAGVAAGGLGAWIRYSQSHRQPPADEGSDGSETLMPRSDPAPAMTPEGALAGPPVSDELLRRLHEGGAGHFTAVVHQWADVAAMAARIPEGARRAGFGGLGLLADAVSEQPAATAHVISALRVGGPGQYRVAYKGSPRHGPQTIVCDGQRCWLVRDGTATIGPAEPPPPDIAGLADPSWLLQCRLSGGEPVTVGGRPGYRLGVVRGAEGWPALLFPAGAAVAVIDSELAIVRRLTSYTDGKPARHFELRDLAASEDEFRPDLPPDLTVTEEATPFGFRNARSAASQNLPLVIATAIGRQAATEAGKAARRLLNRFQEHRPEDGE